MSLVYKYQIRVYILSVCLPPTWRGYTLGEDINTNVIFIRKGYTQRRHTRRHTYEEDIHTNGIFIQRGHTRRGYTRSGHTRGGHTRGGHTRGGHTHDEDIYTDGMSI